MLDGSIQDEPPRGSLGDPRLLAQPGIDAMRHMARGDSARPPIHHLTGIRPTSAELGGSTWAMPVTGWLRNHWGLIGGGVIAFFADAVVGTSIYTGLPPGRMVSTGNLSIEFARPVDPDATMLIGRGRTDHLGRSQGLSSALLEDGLGRLIARASTRCIVRDLPFDPSSLDPIEPFPVADDRPDPYLREVPTVHLVSASEATDREPLHILQAVGAGTSIEGPEHLLTGWPPVEFDNGRAVIEWPATMWFSAGLPNMYGGAIAWAVDKALSSAIYSSLEPNEVNFTLDLHVRYLRPPALDGRPLTVAAQVVHRGRTVRIADAEMVDADGRIVARANSSAMIVTDGLERLAAGSWQVSPGAALDPSAGDVS